MDEKLKEKFGIIRYANCWEDADLLVKGLQVKENSRVVSIASAGDNSFSLLSQGPEQVIAVDINQLQLFLTELKKCAIRTLEYEEFLAFIGVQESDKRLQTFELLKQNLSPECRAWLEGNAPPIQAGLIHAGKFENYFRLFRKAIMPMVHRRKTINQLFQSKSADEQKAFFEERWNNWQWKVLFRIFFSRKVMGSRGRDPAFFKEVTGNVSEEIYQRASSYLVKEEVQQNPYLYYMFYGNYGPLPHYLRKENFQAVKKNIDALLLFKGWAEEVASQYGNITHYNLSNIFEYMSPEQAANCASKLHQASATEAKLLYWNLLVPRNLATLLPEQFAAENEITQQLTSQDQCFFYERCVVNTVK